MNYLFLALICCAILVSAHACSCESDSNSKMQCSTRSTCIANTPVSCLNLNAKDAAHNPFNLAAIGTPIGQIFTPHANQELLDECNWDPQPTNWWELFQSVDISAYALMFTMRFTSLPSATDSTIYEILHLGRGSDPKIYLKGHELFFDARDCVTPLKFTQFNWLDGNGNAQNSLIPFAPYKWMTWVLEVQYPKDCHKGDHRVTVQQMCFPNNKQSVQMPNNCDSAVSTNGGLYSSLNTPATMVEVKDVVFFENNHIPNDLFGDHHDFCELQKQPKCIAPAIADPTDPSICKCPQFYNLFQNVDGTLTCKCALASYDPQATAFGVDSQTCQCKAPYTLLIDSFICGCPCPLLYDPRDQLCKDPCPLTGPHDGIFNDADCKCKPRFVHEADNVCYCPYSIEAGITNLLVDELNCLCPSNLILEANVCKCGLDVNGIQQIYDQHSMMCRSPCPYSPPGHVDSIYSDCNCIAPFDLLVGLTCTCRYTIANANNDDYDGAANVDMTACTCPESFLLVGDDCVCSAANEGKR
jgi:hypothetical protein